MKIISMLFIEQSTIRLIQYLKDCTSGKLHFMEKNYQIQEIDEL